MSRFYFHVVDGAELLTDVEGAHLRDALEARQMAIRSAREILADAIRSGKSRVPEAFVIADEQGQAIETVPFGVVFARAVQGVKAASADAVGTLSLICGVAIGIRMPRMSNDDEYRRQAAECRRMAATPGARWTRMRVEVGRLVAADAAESARTPVRT